VSVSAMQSIYGDRHRPRLEDFHVSGGLAGASPHFFTGFDLMVRLLLLHGLLSAATHFWKRFPKFPVARVASGRTASGVGRPRTARAIPSLALRVSIRLPPAGRAGWRADWVRGRQTRARRGDSLAGASGFNPPSVAGRARWRGTGQSDCWRERRNSRREFA
jgi:hypothetical protein